VWCEGNEYSNFCFAKAAGFVESQCTDGDIFCLLSLSQCGVKEKVNVKRKKYSNQCFAKAAGFAVSQCTDEDPDYNGSDDCDFTLDEVEDDKNFRKGKKKENCADYLRNNGEHKCQKNTKGKSSTIFV